jgi:hypothetical protein
MNKDVSYKSVASWQDDTEERDIRLLVATIGVVGLISFIGLGFKYS